MSYEYSINMYCIILFLVTWKCPFKSVYTFPVSKFTSTIAENKKLLFPSFWEKKYVFISSASFSLFVHLLFFLVWSKCTKTVASNFCRCAAINYAVRLGHVAKFPFLQPWLHLILQGWNMLHVKNLLTLLGFSFCKSCHQVIFVVAPLLIFILNW